MTPNSDGQSPKLLDQMRGVMRLHRYAIRTEQAYGDWVRRYVKFHGMKSRADLVGGKEKVEAPLVPAKAPKANQCHHDTPTRVTMQRHQCQGDTQTVSNRQ